MCKGKLSVHCQAIVQQHALWATKYLLCAQYVSLRLLDNNISKISGNGVQKPTNTHTRNCTIDDKVAWEAGAGILMGAASVKVLSTFTSAISIFFFFLLPSFTYDSHPTGKYGGEEHVFVCIPSKELQCNIPILFSLVLFSIQGPIFLQIQTKKLKIICFNITN